MNAADDFRAIVINGRKRFNGMRRKEHRKKSVLPIVANNLRLGTLVRRFGRLPRCFWKRRAFWNGLSGLAVLASPVLRIKGG